MRDRKSEMVYEDKSYSDDVPAASICEAKRRGSETSNLHAEQG